MRILTPPARAVHGTRDDSRRQGSEWLGLVVLVLTTVWVILQNNGRVSGSPDVPPADFIIITVPRITRVLEACILAVGALCFWRRYHLATHGPLLFAIVGLIALGAVGMIRAPGHAVSQFQGIYVYVAPFLVFLWCVVSKPHAGLVKAGYWVLGGYLALCVLYFAGVQLPLNRDRGDWHRGLFGDAHLFGTWLAVVSCVSFSTFLRCGRPGWLLAAVAALGLSLFPANEKMLLFNFAWIGVATIRRLPRARAGVQAVTLVVLALGSVVLVRGLSAAGDRLLRFDFMADRSLSEIGPVAAWPAVWGAYVQDPPALLLGVGPANFGGVAAGRALATDRRGATQATVRMESMLVTAGVEGAFLLAANTWSNLAAEFGAIGFLLFALGLATITWPILAAPPREAFGGKVRTFVVCTLLAIVFQGFVTPHTNWAEPALTYPMMLSAAFLWCRAEALSLAREAGPVRPAAGP